MSKPKLTVGMATYSDFDGTFFSIQAARMYQDVEDVEFLVIDNNPDSEYGEATRGFCQSASSRHSPIRYIPYTENTGTTQTRQRLFDHAEGDWVLVMDCHVLLEAGALAALKHFYANCSQDEIKDLYTGPLLMDSLKFQQSHFEPEWREQMLGTWATAWINPEGVYKVGRNVDNMLELKTLNTDGPWEATNIPYAGHENVLYDTGYRIAGWGSDTTPFEVPGQGLGMFSSAKEHWLGFNPHFRSFGGEEIYIHWKYKKAGRKTTCLPFLKWNHRFGRVGGPKYPITVEGKMRNYILGYQELGMDLEPVRAHFVDNQGVNPKVWEYVIADPINFDPMDNPFRKNHPNTFMHNIKPEAKSNLGMPLPLVFDNLQTIALFLQTEGARDLDKHAPMLYALASECESAVEVTKRRESTAFLLAGLSRRRKCDDGECLVSGCKKTCVAPATLHSYQEERDSLLSLLASAVSTTAGRHLTYTDYAVQLDNPPAIQGEHDLLFIDTRHTYNRARAELQVYAPHIKKYIVMHDTAASGLKGDDGEKGLLFAIRDFLQDNPEWFVLHHTPEQYGLTVLCRLEEKRPETPIVIWPKSDAQGNACGAGQQLKKQLKRLGFEATEGCSCNLKAAEMDAKGPQWCRDNIEELLDWLKKEADARNRGFLFIRPVVKRVLLHAIREAEKEAAAGKCY